MPEVTVSGTIRRPGLGTRASICRDSRDRIVLDATNWERPAVSVRVTLTPVEAAILRDELDVLLSEEARNASAYAYEIATDGFDQVMP